MIDPTRPRCSCCDKPLRYLTDSVELPRDKAPMTRAAALALLPPTNRQLISVQRAELTYYDPETLGAARHKPGSTPIRRLNFWDGENYIGWPSAGARPPFCGVTCAAAFGRAAYAAGYRLQRKGPTK